MSVLVFVSGRSDHTQRLATIRDIYQRYGVIIDTHTADGVQVGEAFRQAGEPLICLETALPTKFAQTIEAALGVTPPRPAGLENLENLPQRFVVMDADVQAIKTLVAKETGL